MARKATKINACHAMEFSHEALDIDFDALPGDFRRAHKYWNDLRGARRCPAWREVDMMALPLRLVPWCSALNVVDGGDDFVFRFFGTARVRLQGRDYTGRSIKTFDSKWLMAKVLVELNEVLHRREPVLFRTTVTDRSAAGIQASSFDILRMPFGTGNDIDVVLSMVEYASMSRLIYDWLGVEPPIELVRNGQP